MNRVQPQKCFYRITAIATVLLALACFWIFQTTDAAMRNELSGYSKTLSYLVKPTYLKKLNGEPSDVFIDEYHQIKRTLVTNCPRDKSARYFYLVMKDNNGPGYVFAVDSEPESSEDYSPPGQHYFDAPEELGKPFRSGIPSTIGPFTDRWGTWVTAVVPVLDDSRKVTAVFCLDREASHWKQEHFVRFAQPATLAFLIYIIALTYIGSSLKAPSAPKPLLKRLMPPLALMVSILIAGPAIQIYLINSKRILDTSQTEFQEIPIQIKNETDLQAKGLALSLEGLANNSQVVSDLKEQDRQVLYKRWKPTFDQMKRTNQVTHFFFFDKDRKAILRVQKPDKFGDTVHLHTSRKATFTGKVESGIEIGALGTLTVRAVKPVYDNGQLVGYVEMAREIEDAIKNVTNRPGVEVCLAINKNRLNRQEWENDQKSLGRQPDWARFTDSVVMYSSMNRLPDQFAPAVQRSSYGVRKPEPISFNGNTYHVSAVPFNDASGQAVGTLIMMRDVTAETALLRQQTSLAAMMMLVFLALVMGYVFALLRSTDQGIRAQQAAIQESRTRLAATLHSIGDGVISTDSTGCIIHLNAIAEQLTGWTTNEAQGKYVTEVFFIIHAISREVAFNPVNQTLNEGIISALEKDTLLISKSGDEIPIDDSCAPIRDVDGNVIGAVLVFRDISKEKAHSDELRRSQERFEQVAAQSGEMIWEIDTAGMYTFVSEAVTEMLGYKPEEVVRKLFYFDLFPSNSRNSLMVTASEIMYQKRSIRDFTNQLVSRDGQIVTVKTNASPIYDNKGDFVGYRGSDRDITFEQEAQEQLLSQQAELEIERANLQTIIDTIQVGAILVNEHAEIARVNNVIGNMLGCCTSEVVGQKYGDGLCCIVAIESNAGCGSGSPCASCPVRISIDHVMNTSSEIRGIEAPVTLRIDDTQQKFYFSVSASPVTLDGKDHVLISLADITQQKQIEQQLEEANAELATSNTQLEEALILSQEMAAKADMSRTEAELRAQDLDYKSTHDELTGLANRRQFELQVSSRIDNAGNGEHFAILFMDLDKFKLVNDSLGHDVGDLLLKEAGNRLRKCMRDNDLIARMGGDEFTAIINGKNLYSNCERVAKRILDQITRPFDVGNHRLVVGVSVGIAQFPQDGSDTQTLMKHADAAMYSAKQSGRGTYCWYSEEMEVASSTRLAMESELRQAVSNGELCVYYQPIIDIRNGGVYGFEALLRWDHPLKGMISPGIFIPLAEETGLINPIGSFVLKTACQQMRQWQDEGLALEHCGVNVSVAQLKKQSWADSVNRTLLETGLASRHLVIEVTESNYIGLTDEWKKPLARVLGLGVQCALDDFGVGESSLGRLKDLKGAHVKLDGTFLREVENNERDIALLHSMVDMIHGQNAKVTAEWVETPLQNDILRDCGCDFAQGYFHSKPLAAEDFRRYVLQQDQQKRAA